MSSVSIQRAKEVYGGVTEEETLRNMARSGGYRRIYKYKGGEPSDNTYSDYKRIEQPGDAQERAMFASPAIRDPVLIYEDGRYTPQPSAVSQVDQTYVGKKGPCNSCGKEFVQDKQDKSSVLPSMTVSTRCPICKREFRVDVKYVGRYAKCAPCGTRFKIESPNEVVAPSSLTKQPATGNAATSRALPGGEEPTSVLLPPSARCVRAFDGHTDPVLSVSWSPDGRFALSGGCDCTVRLWEVPSGHCVRAFMGHTKTVRSVSWSPDGRFALSGSCDDTVRLWEVPSGHCVRAFVGHTDWVLSVSWSPDGRFALSGGDKTVRFWEVSSGKCVRTFAGHTSRVSCVAWSPDGHFALSGGHDNTIRLWKVSNGQCVRTFAGHAGYVSCVAWSPDGRFTLSGGEDKTIRLWEVSSGKCVRTFAEHANWVKCVAWSPDGHFALSGSYDKTVRLWEMPSGRCLGTFDGHTNYVNSVSWSPDGRFALSGGQDNTIRLWEMQMPGELRFQPSSPVRPFHPIGTTEQGRRNTEQPQGSKYEGDTKVVDDKAAKLLAMEEKTCQLSGTGAKADEVFDELFRDLEHPDSDVRSGASRLLSEYRNALQKLTTIWAESLQSDPRHASLAGRVLGRKIAKGSSDIIPAQVAKMMYGISAAVIPCSCVHCGHLNTGIAAPINGATVPYYHQAHDKGAYALPVLCDKCSKEFFVVWDTDPR